MASWKKITIVIIICFIVFSVSYAFYIWNKPRRDITKEKGIKITAITLFDSFINNEQAANTSFLNKPVEVEGKVSDIKINHAGETVVYLKSSDPIFGINCTFKKPPPKLQKNQTITFKGICTGYLNDVILDEGVLIRSIEN